MNGPILAFEVDGTELSASHVVGDFIVGESFRVDVTALEFTADAPPPQDRLGKDCTIRVTPPAGDGDLVIHGIIFEVVVLGSESDERAPHRFEVRHPSFKLSIGRDHRYFQQMTSVDVAKKLLLAAGVDDVEWAIKGTPRKHDYILQYGESDWDFLRRILAEDGISFSFEFGDEATKIVFFDDSSSAQDIEGATIVHHRGSGLVQTTDAVFDLSTRVSLVHDKAVLRDYAHKKPALDLTAEAGDGSQRSYYDYPGRYELPADGKTLVKHRLEALQTRRHLVSGRATSLRIRPGRAFTIDACALEGASSKLFVTRLSLDFEVHDGGAKRTEIGWEAIPSSIPHRPELRPFAPDAFGPQTAQMVGPAGEVLHTDDSGRVRAQFWWDRTGKRDEKSSTFMRVGQFPLGGSMVRPRIGWDLLVEHQGGDGDMPLVISHLYDGTHMPPYALPANKTRTAWQTATVKGGGANEIRFEDKKGSEEIFLNASKDMEVTVGDMKNRKIGNNHSLKVGANRTVKVGSNRSLQVVADQKVDVGATETIAVTGARTTDVGGKESITIGAARTVTAVGGKSVDADGGRTLTVGGSMSAISAMEVSRMILGSSSVTVGGSWVCAAAQGLDHTTAGAGAETVGGAKLQVGAGGVKVAVKGALAETVGAAHVTSAGGNFGETAEGKIGIQVGGAFLVTTPSIEVEAESEIKIVCGGSSITIKSDSIEVKSPALPAPGATIAKNGGKIQHNP